jgi:hypothetical protein
MGKAVAYVVGLLAVLCLSVGITDILSGAPGTLLYVGLVLAALSVYLYKTLDPGRVGYVKSSPEEVEYPCPVPLDVVKYVYKGLVDEKIIGEHGQTRSYGGLEYKLTEDLVQPFNEWHKVLSFKDPFSQTEFDVFLEKDKVMYIIAQPKGSEHKKTWRYPEHGK